MERQDWRLFDLAELVAKHEARGTPYHEFLRVPSLSCGLYRLPAGAEDHQTAHDEDEVYFVIRGRAQMVLGGQNHPLERGKVIFIPADLDHHIVEVEEDLSMIVFFGSGGPSGGER